MIAVSARGLSLLGVFLFESLQVRVLAGFRALAGLRRLQVECNDPGLCCCCLRGLNRGEGGLVCVQNEKMRMRA